MPSVKGTQTEKNLMTAFAGESQARNRYTYFASAARKEGFIQIGEIFAETADHEKEHANRLFKLLEGGDVEIRASFTAGVMGNTAENLKAAAAGEHYECTEMYPGFADVAKEEGFEAIGTVLRSIAVSEKQHERRFLALLKNIKSGSVFKKSKPVVWWCRNCGHLYEGTEPPAACLACAHPRGFFELLAENW